MKKRRAAFIATEPQQKTQNLNMKVLTVASSLGESYALYLFILSRGVQGSDMFYALKITLKYFV